MAKCLYFRQSMSSGSGGDEDPVNPRNNGPPGPPTSQATDLATPEDMDRLGLSANGEFLDSTMEHQTQSDVKPPQLISEGAVRHPGDQSVDKKRAPTVSMSHGLTFSGVSSLPVNIKSDSFLDLPGSDWNPYDETPSLAEAILNTEFLKSIGIRDDPDGSSGSKMDTSPLTSSNSSSACIPFSAASVMDSLSSLSSDNTLIEESNSEYKEEHATTSTTTTTTTTSRSNSQMIPISKYNPHDEAFQSDVSSNCSSLSDNSSWSAPNNRRSSPQLTHLHHPKPISTKAGTGLTQANKSKPIGTFWSLTNGTGLDPIPEDSITEAPAIYLPLVPPLLPKPATTSYNISFPTTLQPRPDRFDFWRNSTSIGTGRLSGGCHFSTTSSNGPNSAFSSPGAASPTIPQSPISHSPFHGAPNTSSLDSLDLQPMNIIEDGSSSLCKGGSSKHKMASKRTRNPTPTSVTEYEESDGGVSGRKGRRDSQGANSAENKRRDSIKCGLDDLQRMLPHIGTPEEEKISQASVLYEAGKYIHQVKGDDKKISIEIEAVKKEIDDLNNQIESFQNQLPINGAPPLPKVMTIKTLADQFHDHVVQRTLENWKYWVFVNITGHLVHSFDQMVSASSLDELENTSIDWMNTNLTLQQLRKDAYRKLAKLCAKTSIVEAPAKLPEEAMGFVSRGERGYSAKTCFRRKESAPLIDEETSSIHCCSSSGANSVALPSRFNRPERPD